MLCSSPGYIEGIYIFCKPTFFENFTGSIFPSIVEEWSNAISNHNVMWRTVLLFKPPQSPHCYLGAVDHAKKILVLKPFDLDQVCHGNKICSKLALTWKLTLELELAFPAHCISNWKLNGISRTSISKVISNAANESACCSGGQWCAMDPPLGQEVG